MEIELILSKVCPLKEELEFYKLSIVEKQL